MRTAMALLVVVTFLSITRAAEPAGDGPDQLQQLFDGGKYAELLPKLNRALSLKGPAAAEYQKYDLLKMKGETLLRLHRSGPAEMAFREAAKATDKPDDVALATATAALIKQSGGLKYMPKARGERGSPKPEPIDIVEPESRKLAFAAFSTDLLAKAKPAVDAAAHARTLSQVIRAAQGLGDLRPVEFAATGADTQSKQMLGDLSTKASQLLNDAIDQMSSRVTAISTHADQRSAAKGQEYQAPAPGLSTADVNELHRIISNATQLGGAAKSMSQIFGESDDFKGAVTKAETAIADAHRVLQSHGKEPKPAGG